MNIIDLLLLAVLFISVALAVYRGFLASLLGLLACLGSLLFAFLAGPSLAQILGGNQSVADLLATYTDAGSLLGDYSLSVIPVAALNDSILETVMKNVTLPPLIQDILRQNLLTGAFSGTAYSVNEYVTATVVTVLLQAGSFMLCYFACFLALHVLINLVDHVFYFPVLRHFDWLMAAVMGISPTLFEAAMLDGCNSRQIFFKITLPMIRPILVYVLITSLIGGLQMFDVPQILTNGNGNPNRSAMTIIMYLNNHLYSKNYGMGGAVSVLLFILCAILCLFVYSALNREES